MDATYIIIYPDSARPSAIWGIDAMEENKFHSAISRASGDLPNLFRRWIEEWKDHFQSSGEPGFAQRWAAGFDVQKWILDGENISSTIEATTPYRIVRTFKVYARNPQQLSQHKNKKSLLFKTAEDQEK